ncbi:hypothetical protein MBAV_003411 [Candidatus Magnetobacterium bavaricum]|uniref:Uncharacterized protein n=1 Tax=Candidatus Magnetobacterium bavaricum TaxID=29290 RepID=A0A0F3GR35_9BACT|nr:hypothetical protein MBAV_003411 [Candidatus Magnetobacterium bavaricum]
MRAIQKKKGTTPPSIQNPLQEYQPPPRILSEPRGGDIWHISLLYCISCAISAVNNADCITTVDSPGNNSTFAVKK